MLNAPQLRLGLALYLNAWFDLDFERDAAEYQPIRRSDCFSYARDYGFDYWQAEDLWYYVARMDRAYLNWRKDNAPKKPTEDVPTIGGKTKRRGNPN